MEKSPARLYDLDGIFQTAEPAKFLETQAAEIKKSFDDRVELQQDPLKLEELWGIRSDEIDRFLSFSLQGDPSFDLANSRRIFEPDTNMWRSLIAHPWGNMYEEMASIFMGAVQIGYFGDSNVVYATLFQARAKTNPRPNSVYLWDHDTYCIDDVLAETIDDFAFQIAISSAYRTERISRRTARTLWKKLSGCVHVGWYASGGLASASDEDFDEPDEEDLEENYELGEFENDLDEKNNVRFFYWRSEWIIRLLEADSERNLEHVKSCFRPGFNLPLDDEAHKTRVEGGKVYPPTAIYLLWRNFWFEHNERLEECLTAYSDHSARVVRDLVALLRDIAAGQVEIGGIKNIIELRKQFSELDLDPQRSSDRDVEQAAAKLKKMQWLLELAKEADHRVSDAAHADIENILELAWQHVRDSDAMKVIEIAARRIPGYELQWKALDWVRERRYEVDSRSMPEEAEKIGVWLGKLEKNRSLILQPFIWTQIYVPDYATPAILLQAIGQTPGALDARLPSILFSQLDEIDEYNHKRELALRVLMLFPEQKLLTRLYALVDEFYKIIEDKRGYDIGLALIPWEDFLGAIAAAFLREANPASPEKLKACAVILQLAQFAGMNHHHRLAAQLLPALIAWGENDFDILQLIARLFSGVDDPERWAALRGIETLAQRSPDATASFFAPEIENPADHDNAVTLLHYRARRALKNAWPKKYKDVEAASKAIEHARKLGNYGSEGWMEWRIIECEMAGLFPELKLDYIRQHLYSSDSKVRKAAKEAYQKRGVVPPSTVPLDWVIIEQLVESTDNGDAAALAVAKLLSDPSSVDRTAAALWLYEYPSQIAAPIIADFVKSQFKNFDTQGHGEKLPHEIEWIIRALCRHSQFPETTGIIKQCLGTPESDIAGAVLVDLEMLPANFAAQLLPIVHKDEGWRRCFIARWALTRLEEPDVIAAMKANKLTEKKLRSWA